MIYKKLPSLLCLLLAILVSASAINLGFTANGRPARILREEEDARGVAAQLVDCLDAGDFRRAGDYLQGSLVLPREEGADAATLLWNYYRESLTGELIGQPYLDARGYYQDAVFRAVDLDELTCRMKELAPGLVTRRIETAEDPNQIYNKDLSLREELIADLLCEAAQKAMAEKTEMRECRVQLRLCYENGAWFVQPDQTLMDILAGRMGDG